MKQYVTFVKDEEESRKVQEALSMAGFDTLGGHHYGPFVFFGNDILMSWGDDFVCVMDYEQGRTYTAVNAAYVIKDPFQLEGANRPDPTHVIDGKEYSESTILSALREYVG